ncbi:MAG: PQQ-like beta-propeller repeat protein [Planctomycetes bacterium]|nr:PQQ-like beta-propeller repeat protein [Planctomycetota bacterium]
MRRFLLGLSVFALLLGAWHVTTLDAQAATGPSAMAEGIEFKDGDRYWIPMNTEANSLAIFTESVQVITFYNKTSAEMTLNKVELTHAEGVEPEEFTLLKNEIKRSPLEFAETKLEAGKGTFALKVRFYPVESGERNSTLTYTYDTDKTFTIKLAGRARENAKFFSHGVTSLHKLFGASKTDEILSTAVGDAEGNIYFSGQATQIVDKFSTDIIYGRINADGTLAWAKLWNGPYMDKSPDSGQNAQTGGTANSLALDEAGNLYLAGTTSDDKSNSIFAALVMKIDGKTGEPLWEKLWRPEWAKSALGRHSAEAYGLTVRGSRVFVTGFAYGEILALAFNTEDGATLFQRSIDITPGQNDRGYAIAAGADGSVVIGGLAADTAFLLKLTGCDGDAPKLAWAKRIELGRGSNINSIDLDPEGGIYASLDRRGATTFFSAAKFLPDGELKWAMTYVGNNGDRNNTHMVRYAGDTVLVGGRLAASGIYDTSSGDGLLLGLNSSTGHERWSAFYYTGTGPDEVGEHRVKGAFITGKTLTIVGQSYTGSANGVRYWGYWYNGVTKLEEYKPDSIVIALAEDVAKDVAKGGVKEGKDARTIVDLKEKMQWQDAKGKTGEPSDGDISVWQITLE